MKNKKKQVKMLELDTEIVSDLEASDEDTEAIQGGGRGGSSVGVLR